MNDEAKPNTPMSAQDFNHKSCLVLILGLNDISLYIGSYEEY